MSPPRIRGDRTVDKFAGYFITTVFVWGGLAALLGARGTFALLLVVPSFILVVVGVKLLDGITADKK